MIPSFPAFKRLELCDRDAIDAVVSQYAPYSDYNFNSMWSYDTQNTIKISMLHTNLVVYFQDYVTREHFYSFLGVERVHETITSLLNYDTSEVSSRSIKLIPDMILPHILNGDFGYCIEEDFDNHDYILSARDLATLSGDRFRGQRNFVHRFYSHNPTFDIIALDLGKCRVQDDIINLFCVWENNKGALRENTVTELMAIRRILALPDVTMLHSIGIYVCDHLVAFSIFEFVQKQHAIIHFEKANISYVGAFQMINHMTAKYLMEMGSLYVNIEQDLGIPGLRKAKRQWRPVHYLKKYTIHEK